ncbi:uncharacterized protein [Parasteatoda tepidariorum]|uniref:uncharacterized protein n=1 Tax=Parasteatoda tepidariorum TaxID=114398 RepID=UPI00077FBE35|nr:uncharacterized protein LOC107451511 [Parasteatoda tepidariorum]
MNFCLVLVLAFVAVVTSQLPSDEEEMNMMRMLCISGTDEMFNGIDNCFQRYASQRNLEISVICKERIFGSADKEPSFYVRQGCQNMTLIEQIGVCYEENNQNRKEMVNEEEAAKCLAEVFQRYPLNMNPETESSEE